MSSGQTRYRVRADGFGRRKGQHGCRKAVSDARGWFQGGGEVIEFRGYFLFTT